VLTTFFVPLTVWGTQNNSSLYTAKALMSIAVKSRPVKTWGPVDGRGHAMFGWAMEEEAKLEFTITVNWRRKDGSIATTQLGTLDRGACRSAEDVPTRLFSELLTTFFVTADGLRTQNNEAKITRNNSSLYSQRLPITATRPARALDRARTPSSQASAMPRESI
jgi:hypothetical protein